MPEIPADSEGAFKRVEAALMAVEEPHTRLLSIVPEPLARELRLEVEVMEGRLAVILAPYHAEAQGVVRQDMEQAVELARATIWAQLHHEEQVLDVSALHKAVEEATPVRGVGLLNLDLLRNLGLVTPEEADDIRAGRGFADMARDLQRLGPLMRANWSVLEPLQALRSDPADRLTEALIDRMVPLGTELAEADRRRQPKEGEVDWRDMLLRCHTLLDRTWERLRSMAVGGYGFAGDMARSRAGHPSLRVLSARR